MDLIYPKEKNTSYPFMDLDVKYKSGISYLKIFSNSNETIYLTSITNKELSFSDGTIIPYPLFLNEPVFTEQYNVVFENKPKYPITGEFELHPFAYIYRNFTGVRDVFINGEKKETITFDTTNLIKENIDANTIAFHNYYQSNRTPLQQLGTCTGKNIIIVGENLITVSGLKVGTMIEDSNLQCPTVFNPDLVGDQGDPGQAGQDGLDGNNIFEYLYNPDACEQECPGEEPCESAVGLCALEAGSYSEDSSLATITSCTTSMIFPSEEEEWDVNTRFPHF